MFVVFILLVYFLFFVRKMSKRLGDKVAVMRAKKFEKMFKKNADLILR